MKRILLIEQNKNILDETSEFLQNKGFNVACVSNGSSGIQKALEFSPDIILCDSEGSGLSGYEVFNTLQQINSTAIIPFVFLMNDASKDEIRAAMNLGADDYLVKPFNSDDLLNLIQIRLEKQEKIINLADEKFHTLMQNSNTGVFIYQDEKISYVNKKCCEIVAYSERELLGMNLVNIIYKDDIHFVIDKISRCFRGIHKDIEIEFRAIRGDQQIIEVAMTGNTLNIRGKKSLIATLRLNTDSQTRKKPFIPQKTPVELTKREEEVLNLICEGLSNTEIGKKLNISERTVEGHRANLLSKTSCKNSVCLAIFAVKYGFYSLQ
ncbi:MAG TPA: response regulator [Bacteroidales bacterium]|nr:response regulator [Bacteroidales bacterium]